MDVRQRVLEYVELLSQPSRQLDYETSVPRADSHAELVRWFCDALFRPKSRPFLDAFTENEIKDLARLYGLLIESRQLRASSLADLLREPEWRRIARFAQQLVATIDGNPSAEGFGTAMVQKNPPRRSFSEVLAPRGE
jgi:hypothetical protein